jgi:hypothetical protein
MAPCACSPPASGLHRLVFKERQVEPERMHPGLPGALKQLLARYAHMGCQQAARMRLADRT